jgi:hypothetical protein
MVNVSAALGAYTSRAIYIGESPLATQIFGWPGGAFGAKLIEGLIDRQVAVQFQWEHDWLICGIIMIPARAQVLARR